MADDGQYISSDEQYGALLGNLINPPEESPDYSQRGSTPNPPPPPPAVPATAPTQTPGTPPRPASVAPSGNPPAGQKTWADYVRGGLTAAQDAQVKSQAAIDSVQGQPTAEAANAPLEAQRTAIATPTPMRDAQGKLLPQYRPSFWQQVARVGNNFRAGFAGQPDKATPYSAPTRAYDVAEQARQAKVGSLDQQMQQNITNEKADTDRAKAVATEQRASATTALDIGKTATGQETAEHNTELANVRQQLADQGGTPKTYEQAVIASKDPDLPPAKRQQYTDAAAEMQKAEIKKFEYASRATAGDDPFNRRQPMIDAATAEVQKLNDYEWDADANDGKGGFIEPGNTTKFMSVEEFTDAKNKIATKLDQDLTKAKLRPLGVRFTTAATRPAAAQPAAPPTATPTQTAPKSAAETQAGQVYKGYRYLGGDKTKQSSWQKVNQ